MTTLNDIKYADWQPKLNQIGEISEGIDDINQCIAIILSTGAQVETKDGKIIFSTDEDAVINIGEEFADIAASANLEGSIGNGYLTGEINNLITPAGYVDKAENNLLIIGKQPETYKPLEDEGSIVATNLTNQYFMPNQAKIIIKRSF